MSDISFPCPKCGAGLEADPKTIGQATLCPQCNKPLIVPRAPRKPLVLNILLLLLGAVAVFYAYTMGYSTGAIDSKSAGYTIGFAAGSKAGYATGAVAGRKDGLTEGRRQGFSEGEVAGISTGKVTGFMDGYRHGWADGETRALAEGNTKGFAEGMKKGTETGQQTGHAEGYRQGFSEGDAKGQITGKQLGYLDGMHHGLSDGEAKGLAAGKKLGYEDGYRQGWSEGEKAVWGVLHLKAGTPEGTVLKWLGPPDRDEGYVGEKDLFLIYGKVHIRVVADYDGTRKVHSWTGDLSALLDDRLGEKK